MNVYDYDAISRLSSWLRDYGGKATQVFQDDLERVLKLAQETAENRCSKCQEKSKGLMRACSYQAEVFGGEIKICDCCDDCRHECAMDI